MNGLCVYIFFFLDDQNIKWLSIQELHLYETVIGCYAAVTSMLNINFGGRVAQGRTVTNNFGDYHAAITLQLYIKLLFQK